MKGKILHKFMPAFLIIAAYAPWMPPDARAQNNNKMATTAGLEVGMSASITVSPSATLTVKGSLTINPGGEIINQGTIKGYGTWENNGIFNERTGIVILSGTGDCIQGATTFNNLEIDVTGTTDISATLGDNQKVWNTLTLTKGIFDVTGGGSDSLILLSDETGTARVAEVTGGSMTGNMTMQRYIGPGVADGWRMLSSPVLAAQIEEWNDDFLMSGFTGTDDPLSSFTSVWYYDETDPGTNDLGWIAPNNTSDVMLPGRGYMAWVGDLAGDPITKTLDITSGLTMGPQAITVSYTDGPKDDTHDGWNLIGNPYPSDVLWDAVTITGTLTQWAYFYDPNTKTYISRDQSSGYEIPSHQGFWVKVAGPGNHFETVTFNEGNKTTDGNKFLKMGSTEKIAMTLSGYGSYNKAEVRFNDEASYAYDMQYDAFKLPCLDPNYVNLATVSSDNLELQVNSIPLDYMNFNVPIKIYWGETVPANTSQPLTLTIDELPSPLTSVCLEDLVTGSSVDLYEGAQHNFTASYAPNPTPRFILHGLASSCVTSSEDLYGMMEEQISIRKIQEDVVVYLNLLETSEVEIKVLNVLGQELYKETLSAKMDKVVIRAPFKSAGSYFITVTTAKINKTEKMFSSE